VREFRVEVTLTTRHLAAFTTLMLALIVVLAYYPSVMRALFYKAPVTLRVGKSGYKVGEVLELEVCIIGELDSDMVQILVQDTSGLVVYAAIIRAEEGCTTLQFPLREGLEEGTYRVVAKAGEEVLSTTTFKVSATS